MHSALFSVLTGLFVMGINPAHADEFDHGARDMPLPEGVLGSEPDINLEFWYGDTDNNCTRGTPTLPCDGEEDHWIAQRFTPPSNYFTVTGLRYYLFDGTTGLGTQLCDASLGHTVQLIVGTDEVPRSEPDVVFSWSVVPGTPGTGVVGFQRSVPDIELGPNEYLYVAIKYYGDLKPDTGTCNTSSGTSICVETCMDGEPGFWSNTSEEPYDWTDLKAFGITSTPNVAIRGVAHSKR
ncbi:MAG: hypothetical protein AAFV53_16485 [Myxococcota bacterium]